MNTKTLLAFLQALPASTDANLTNDSAIKQLRNKLVQVNQQSEIFPKDWENIQGKLTNILENNTAINQLYQETQAQLEGVDITPDLLPTAAELKAVQPPNRQIGTLGYHPGPDSNSDSENYEIINLAIIVLNDEKPATTSQSLLQRLNAFLKQKPKTDKA
ncbi:MAG TPA: hypothetical protein DCM38_12555 [Gammaproteobacteria bacterium]|nr:hypothetical protein [Gammaproteobacteria bacterium]